MDISNIDYQSTMDYFKKTRRLAFALGITQQAVYLWRKQVPEARKAQIALLIAGDWNKSDVARAYDSRYSMGDVA